MSVSVPVVVDAAAVPLADPSAIVSPAIVAVTPLAHVEDLAPARRR